MGYIDKYGNYQGNPNDPYSRSDAASVKKYKKPSTSISAKEKKQRKVATAAMIADSSKSDQNIMDDQGDVMIPSSSISGTFPSKKATFLHAIGSCSCDSTGCCDVSGPI
jgi:hypothetical protein